MTAVADALGAIHANTDDAVLMTPLLVDPSDVDGARSAQRCDQGRLAGEALVVKDCIAVPNAPTTAGCLALASHSIPVGGAVSRLIAEGAVVVARASMHELAFGVTGRNDWRGMPVNPAAPERVPGGSSSGSAVAVAAGLVDVALGTDTGGSCRIPASCCGVVGFRPSTGRYPSDGLITLSQTRDTVGILARALDDVIRYDAVLAGTDGGPSAHEVPERIAVLDDAGRRICDQPVLDAYDQWLERCSASGIDLIEVDIEPLLNDNDRASFPIALRETILSFTSVAETVGLSFDEFVEAVSGEDVRDLLRLDVPTEDDRRHALEDVIPAMRSWYALTVGPGGLADVLAIPTMPVLAPLRSETDTIEMNGELVPTFATMAAFTSPASLAGMPSLSIPSELSRGSAVAPVGIMLEGWRHSDESLLASARSLAEVLR